MRKAIKGILIVLAVAALVVIAALPVAVPPLVESLIRSKVREFGLKDPCTKMHFGYCWRNGPGIAGDLKISFPDTPWRLSAEFGASCCEWSAAITMPEIHFDETDAIIRTLLEKYPATAVSNLTFTGSIALDAKARRTFQMPVPAWSARLPLRDLSARFTMGEKPYAVDGFSVTAGANGIADHVDVAPMRPQAKSISAAGFALTNFHASVRMTEKALLITEASAGLCGGEVNLYSLYLNPQNLNAGFTLFLNDVNAGEALAYLNGFNGETSGLLHGKVKLFVREGGKSIHMGNAFLYSTPGETGKLKLSNPTAVTDNLALAGVDEAARKNVADALTDLDYSVLRFDLKRSSGKSATLSAAIRGTATRGKQSVPVDITINFNGALEQIVNTGLNYSNLLKGKQK